MKLFIALLCFLLFFSFAANADSFKPGYIVNLQGDTIRGLISFSSGLYHLNKIVFKVKNSDTGEILRPNNILAAGLNTGQTYKTYTGKITRDRIIEDKALNARDTSYIIDTVFLKVLQTGKHITLYSYADVIKTRFYYTTNVSPIPIELGYRIYYDINAVNANISKGRTVYENTFMQQFFALALNFNMLDDKFQRMIEEARYDKAYLIPIAKKLNASTNNAP